jgi:hypothetical protein
MGRYDDIAGYYDNVAGYAVGDMGDLDDTGYAPRRRGRQGPMRQQLQVRSTPANVQDVAGVSPVAMKRMMFGLGSVFFAVAQPLTTQTLSVQPQVPFKGNRLVIDIARTGATSTGLVTVTAFSVGIKDQRAGFGAIGAGALSSTGTDIVIVMDPAGPGVTITLSITISAIPTTTDRVDVNATLFGSGIS